MDLPKHPDALPNEDFSDSVEEKAASRRQDQEDVAAGRRTAEEVQRANAYWVLGDPKDATITNAAEADEHL